MKVREIREYLGVSSSTLYYWKKSRPELFNFLRTITLDECLDFLKKEP